MWIFKICEYAENMQIWEYTNIQICEYANTCIFEYANMCICGEYANWQIFWICEYANMPTCKYAVSMQIFGKYANIRWTCMW